MVYFPNKIINLILSFRENYPTAKIIKPVIEKYNTQYIFRESELDFFKDYNMRLIDFNEHYFEAIKYQKKTYGYDDNNIERNPHMGWNSDIDVCVVIIMKKIPNDESSSFFVLTVDDSDDDDSDDDDDDND